MQTAAELVACLLPPCQRVLDQAHVNRLLTDIREDLAEHGAHSVLQSISVAVLPNGTTYVLDGQHRMAAFSSEEMRRDPRVMSTRLPVVVYRCADTSDMLRRYARINHNLPIHPMELELSWAEKAKPLLELLQRRWRVYISKSASPQCPNISEPNLKSALQARASDISDPRITGPELAADVDELNRVIISRLPLQLGNDQRLQKCRVKQPNDPCFLGLWRDCGWLDLIMHRRLRSNTAWDTLDIGHPGAAALGAAHNLRTAIPRHVRRLVWAKANDPNALVGSCYVCGEPLNFDCMECAHDVPHCLGGESTVANMWPACRGCNRDMGIRKLADYRAHIVATCEPSAPTPMQVDAAVVTVTIGASR